MVAGDRVAVPGMAFPFEIHVHNGGPFAFENLTVRSLTDGDLEFGGDHDLALLLALKPSNDALELPKRGPKAVI